MMTAVFVDEPSPPEYLTSSFFGSAKTKTDINTKIRQGNDFIRRRRFKVIRGTKDLAESGAHTRRTPRRWRGGRGETKSRSVLECGVP
jgi:hypothetical protein